MSQGALTQTGNPLDLAIEGEGFFQVQTPNGPRYTAMAVFTAHRADNWFTAAGDAVLSITGQPIPIPPGEVTVGVDGVLFGGRRCGGHGGRFHLSGRHAVDPRGRQPAISRPQGVKPALAQNAALQQGTIENANQGVIQGSLNLILVQREAEMMQKGAHRFPHRVSTRSPARIYPECESSEQ